MRLRYERMYDVHSQRYGKLSPFSFSAARPLFCLLCGTHRHCTADCVEFIHLHKAAQADPSRKWDLLNALCFAPAYTSKDLALFSTGRARGNNAAGQKRMRESKGGPTAAAGAAAAADAGEQQGESGVAAASKPAAAATVGAATGVSALGGVAVPATGISSAQQPAAAAGGDAALLQLVEQLRAEVTQVKAANKQLHERLRWAQQLLGQSQVELSVASCKKARVN
jgi:hypothetical protein